MSTRSTGKRIGEHEGDIRPALEAELSAASDVMTQRATPLGLPTLVALVIANMIGAGVFTTSGFALADLGSPLRVLAAWLVGGLVALCGALSYGALARAIPASGGEYLYLSRTIHPLVGFLAGWVSLLAGFTGAIAYSALTFAAYAGAGGAAQGATASWIATGVIVVAAALHAVRLRQGAWTQNAVVGLKLILIAVFCAIALAGGPPAWIGLAEVQITGPREAFSITAFALTLMWISFSYSGFNAAVYLAGEIPAARAHVPRALVIGTSVTLLLYLLLNSALVLVPPFAAVAGVQDVAAAAAQYIGGETLALGVRVVIGLALFTSVSAMIMVGPRVYAKMADDGLMPRVLRFEGETPAASIAAQAALAIIVVWLAGLRELLSYLGFTLGLSTAATVASLFVLVRRERNLAGRLPGYPWAPAAFVIFTLLLAALAALRDPREMFAALATVLSGAVLYLVIRRGRR
jgi:APA family basic amino acid/polyamine antiporter